MQNRIKEFRKKAGLTMEETAHRLGITVSQVNRIENGRSSTTTIRLAEFAEVFGCHAADLIDDRLPIDPNLGVDQERLRDVIIQTERLMSKNQKSVKPERKAEIILSLLSLENDRLDDSDGKVDVKRYAALLGL
ncbi:MAG: helix-turn-helix domain-containing protein [Terasakiella sp.]|uniref:helix-turn-helix domain-containing protein n=1 Tax=unclassified Terasakiella TaxID=2614952 RepID=UPI003AFF6B0D